MSERVKKRDFHYGKVFTYSYIVLLVTELCVKMCMYMQHATVTLYILDSGGSATFVGSVLAVQLLSSLVFRPISGNLIDRNKVFPMLMGTVIYSAAISLFLLDLPIHFILGIVIIQGVGYALAETGIYALASATVPEEYMTRCYTYLNVVETLAAAVSTTFAIFLRNRSGFHTVFLVIFGISILALGCIALLSSTSWKLNGGHYYHPSHLLHPRGTGNRRRERAPREEGNFLTRVVDRNALTPAILYMLIMFAGEAILGFLVAYGKTEGIGNPGVFYTVQAVCVYVSSMFVGRIDERHGLKAVLLPGFAFYFLALAGIFLNISYTSIIICGMLFGCGVGFAQPALGSLAVKMAGEEHRGKANSTIGLLLDLGGSAASLTYGRMVDSFGYRSIYATAAMIVVVITIVYLVMRQKKLLL